LPFPGHWPKPEHADDWPGIHDGMKYVMSSSMETSDWKNTVFLKRLTDIEKLKNSDGPDLQVHGSG